MKIFAISMECFDTESQYLESHVLLHAPMDSLAEIQNLMHGAGSVKCIIHHYEELHGDE